MQHARTFPLAILLASLAASAVRADQDPDPARQLDELFDALPHTSFEWSKSGSSERAAMRVPVDLDGTRGWFQLDTGLDVTLVYGKLAVERGWETHDGMIHVPSLDIGTMSLGPVWIRSREEAGGKGELIGSLGLDLLVGHLVLIDFPGRRLALMRTGDAPVWLWQRATWTPATLRDAKLFPYVTLGGEEMDDLVFDTGSSDFDVIVDFDDWKAITGRDGPDAATERRKVSSWGKKITAIGAPARGPLVIGSARIAEPRVFYLKEQPELFAQWPFPAGGLVGCAPFRDRVVILDLGIRPRFGLLE